LLFFCFFAQSFELTAQTLSNCPSLETGGTLTSPPNFSDCTFANVAAISFDGDGDIVIHKSSFSGYTVTALTLSPSGSVLLSSVTFTGFTLSNNFYAAVVKKATELRLSDVHFEEIKGMALDGGKDAQNGDLGMCTLYDVTCKG
jgi:hypothetical protein